MRQVTRKSNLCFPGLPDDPVVEGAEQDGDHGVSFHLQVSRDKAACVFCRPAAAVAAACFFFRAQDRSPLLEIAVGDELHHLRPGSVEKGHIDHEPEAESFELAGADNDWTSCGR